MINIDSLYKSIFNQETRRFDRSNRYYTVLIDVAESSEANREVYSRLEIYMNDASYTLCHITAPDDGESVKNEITEAVRAMEENPNSEPPSYNYCILVNFADARRDTSCIGTILKAIKTRKDDIFTVIVTIPPDMPETKALFINVKNEIPASIKPHQLNLYVFAPEDHRFNIISVHNSVCAAIVLNSSKEQFVYHSNRIRNATGKAKNEAMMIAPAAKAQMEEDSRIQWSVLYAKFFDKKNDFLEWYFKKLCSKIKTIDQAGFESEADRLYDSLIPEINQKSVIRAAKNAVDMIPRVIPQYKEDQDDTLKMRFDTMYGDGGVKTVDLTLKATFSGYLNLRTDKHIEETAEKLFALYSEYASDDLYRVIVQHLDEYNKKLGIKLKADDLAKNNCVDKHKEISDYATHYLGLYLQQEKVKFWNDIMALTADRKKYDPYCDKARSNNLECMNILANTREFSFEHEFPDIVVRSLTVGELFDIANNQSICNDIRNQYEKCSDSVVKATETPTNCDVVFSLRTDSRFYSEEAVEVFENGFSICGVERNGYYLEFLNTN